MTEVALLHYQPGESWLHNHHPGAKFLEYLSINIVLVFLPLWSCGFFALPAVVLLPLVGFERRFFKRMTATVTVVLAFFILIGMLSVEGVYFSVSGWWQGLLQGFRFVTLTLWAVLFLGVTDPWDIAGVIGSLGGQQPGGQGRPLREGAPDCVSASHAHARRGLDGKRRVRRFLRIFPTIGFAIAMVLSFFPMLLDRAVEQGQALRNRGLTFRQPIRYAALLGSKLVISVELLADDITMAVESRCYTPDRRWSLPKWRLTDTLGVLLVAGVLTAAMVLL